MIRIYWLPCGVLAALLIAASLFAPFNHDEDQYYAAAHALSHGRMYADFIYLQTPLNAVLGNALIALSPGNSLWLLRVGQALIGTALFALVLRENLRASSSARIALLSALLMVSSYSFLFVSTVYRNDILPALLAAAAIVLLVREAAQREGGHWAGWLAGGLFIGLAASAKANFLLLAGAPIVWLLLASSIPFAARVRLLLAFAAGGLIGALPTLLPLFAHPEKFLWQVVHFGALAPLDWYREVGQAERLTLLGRLWGSILILAQGPALPALALIVASRLFRRDSSSSDQRALLLDLFILTGLLAAFLPNPAWRQYFIAPIPALFLRLPAVLEALTPRARKLSGGVLILFALVGIAAFGALLMKAAKNPDRRLLNHWRESVWVGQQMARIPGNATIASLSPHLALDAERTIHPRFVSGVFVYRWRGRDEEIFSMGGVTPSTLQAAFAACPPAAIITGYESGDGNSFEVDLELALRAYASAHGYRPLKSPFGGATLYLSPAAPKCSAWKSSVGR